MISYIGGKYRQAKWINEFIPEKIEKYIEVFGGAFWVYLRSNIKAKKVVYNDVNPFMANLFACCREYDTFLSYLNQYELKNSKQKTLKVLILSLAQNMYILQHRHSAVLSAKKQKWLI